jgi:hypothetical protein
MVDGAMNGSSAAHDPDKQPNTYYPSNGISGVWRSCGALMGCSADSIGMMLSLGSWGRSFAGRRMSRARILTIGMPCKVRLMQYFSATSFIVEEA